MEHYKDSLIGGLFGSSVCYIRRCLFHVLSVGPVPQHLAFILDGNRRYAKKWNLEEGMGYKAGFLSLMSIMKYCYELGVKYITIYAFSIDNFKRRPDEVQSVMNLMQEKIEGLLKEESIVKQYGVRVYFIGNLKLLSEPVRHAAEKAMEVTSKNDKSILLICVAYTSTDEITHAAQVSCEDKWAQIKSLVKVRNGEEKEVVKVRNGEEKDVVKVQNGEEKEVSTKDDVIKLGDLERHMYMGVAPDPDILVRTSGETRLSNFLLWQTSNCLLYSPKALWPEIGLRHLVWAVLNFQRSYAYLERRRKMI